MGTANTFVTAVASMFSFAIDYEWVETAPTARQPHGDHPDTDAGVPWRGGNLSFQLSKALAKIPDFPTHRNVHGLRKLCATILTQAGCSTHEIGRVTGHRTLAMIQHYTDSVGQQASAEAAMAKLELWRPKARMRPR